MKKKDKNHFTSFKGAALNHFFVGGKLLCFGMLFNSYMYTIASEDNNDGEYSLLDSALRENDELEVEGRDSFIELSQVQRW